jgi:hypothetical protein
MEPIFETSDTGSKVFLLDGEPPYLQFRLGLDEPLIVLPLPAMLEVYRLFNGIWFSGLWRQLNICNAAMCVTHPHGHLRNDNCPKMTDYESKMFDEYNSRLRTVHMEENRPPVADGTTSDSA